MSLSVFYFKVKVLLLLVVMPFAANYNLVGLVAVLSCILDGVYCVSRIRAGGLKVYAAPFSAACLFLLWNVLIYILFDYSGTERLIQVVCVTLCFFSSCCLEYKCVDLRFVRNVIIFQLVLFCIWWPLSGFVTNYYGAFYGHGNFLGGLLVNYIVILVVLHHMVDRKKKWLYVAIYVSIFFLMRMANNRSVYLTMAIFLGGCLLMNWKKPKNAKPRGLFLILIMAAAGLAFTIIYPQLLNTSLGMSLEMLSRTVFNKNFFSGRQVIWLNIEELIIQSPYIGYGLDARPEHFFSTSLSSHNLWLQTALQSGLIGVVFLLIFYLTAIFSSYHRLNKEWYVSAAFGAAYIIHECFEISLTQNNFCLGIIVWFLLGLMVAIKRYRILMNNP